MRDQIRRAAISVITYIAEGSTRPSSKEFLFFLTYSYGSLKEIDALLSLSKDLQYISAAEFCTTISHLDEVSSGLYLLMRHVEKDTPYSHFQQFNKVFDGDKTENRRNSVISDFCNGKQTVSQDNNQNR
jgi:four helix bundle protein